MERAMGVEPTFEAWEASILPMNYARLSSVRTLLYHIILKMQAKKRPLCTYAHTMMRAVPLPVPLFRPFYEIMSNNG